MGDEHLPSHRQLFAALIPPSPLPAGSEFAAGTADAAAAAAVSKAITDRPSPFAEQHSNWRRQLLTLHVIFPNLLLPALDMLDRGLVSRLVVADGEEQRASEAATASVLSHAVVEAEIGSTDEQSTSRSANNGQEPGVTGRICMYTVQSAASPTSRRRRHTPLRAKTYAVHLDAWNCSCGGFALDAYSHYDAKSKDEQQPCQSSALPLRPASLELASPDDDFPCCKHLLACLLAEKWKTTTGHVRDRYITKEELAAIIGGP
ncbi:hypothetical protein BBK36DRAFT_1189514 [Trichoderma citrinoviride]|uniref:SWIM-type domain-containing protein n=1 Tax=Trichoderma citrinoviride TaxID=58853 RepID=A0A2T4BLB0_9HYPO|nr:hypothetical protein BBK36DRAFT_1189514 [Trichoderma citrinoviride]PTB70096.1 hypothetical protein BBK36DRAFT_1189514 [Trichoderma citrinoviride]